jgi:hypothetical protein
MQSKYVYKIFGCGVFRKKIFKTVNMVRLVIFAPAKTIEI